MPPKFHPNEYFEDSYGIFHDKYFSNQEEQTNE